MQTKTVSSLLISAIFLLLLPNIFASENNSTQEDFRAEVYQITKQYKQVKRIMSIKPAYTSEKIPSYLMDFAKEFNQNNFLENCRRLSSAPEVNEPKYKRQKRELQTATDYVKNLSETAEKAGAYRRLEELIERINNYPTSADAFQKSAGRYIEILQYFLPNDSKLNRIKSEIDRAASAAPAAITARQGEEKNKFNKFFDDLTSTLGDNLEFGNKKASNNPSTKPLSEPILRDAALEAEFKRVGQLAVGTGFKISFISIQSRGWGEEKDALGRPISRSMLATVAGTDNSGNCWKQYMTFTQDYNLVSGWTKTFFDRRWSDDKTPIVCSLIP